MPSKGKNGRRKGGGKKKGGGGAQVKDSLQTQAATESSETSTPAINGAITHEVEGSGPGTPPNMNVESRNQASPRDSSGEGAVPDSWEDLEGNGIAPEGSAAAAHPEVDASEDSGEIRGPVDEEEELESNALDQVCEHPLDRGGMGVEGIAPRSLEGSGSFNGLDIVTSSGELVKDERIQDLEGELLAARLQYSTMEGELEQAQRSSDTRSSQLLEVQAVMQEMEEKIQGLEGTLQEAERGKLDAVDSAVRDKEVEMEQQLLQVQHNYQSVNDQLNSTLEENSILKQRLADNAHDSTRLSGLHEEVLSLRDKSAQLDDELNSANELIRDQSKMLAESSVQAQTMEERIKELEDQSSSLISNLDDKDGELTQLSANVTSQIHECQEIQAQKDSLRALLAEIEQQKDNLILAADEKTALISEKDSLLLQYEQEIQTLKAENSSLSIACEEKSSTDNNGLQSADAQESESEMLSELQEELIQSRQETESTRNKLKAAIKKGKRIEQERANLEIQIQKMRTEIESNLLRQKDQEERIAQGNEADSRSRCTISELEQALKDRDETILSVENTHGEIEGKLRAAVRKGKKIEQSKKELEARVLELKTSTADKSAHIEVLEAQVGKISELDFAQVQARAEWAQGEVERLQEALQAKSEELESSSSLQKDLQGQVGSLEDQLKKMEEENSSLRASSACLEDYESRARAAEAERRRMEEELKEKEEEVGQHRAKVARARDGIEKMKQEKEVLAVQVEELSDRIASLELDNAELIDLCENVHSPRSIEDDNNQAVDPDLDDWVHRALHAERKAADAEAQKQTEISAMLEKLTVAERTASSTVERAEKLEHALEISKREASNVKDALDTSTIRITNLEADLTGFQTALEQVSELQTELSTRDAELQHLKDGSNPPSGSGNFSHELSTDVTGKIRTTHEAAKSLANQMGLPFYESNTGNDDGALDAVRILLEGVGFGMQRQQQRMEEQMQHINMLSNVQNELQVAKVEKGNLERELQRQRRLSSSGGSGHLSVDISGPLVEPVPSAIVQPVAKKRRDVHDIESGVSEIEELIEDDPHSEFLPLTVMGMLKNAPPNMIYGLTLADRAYLAATKALGGKPVIRIAVAAYAVVFHCILLFCLFF